MSLGVFETKHKWATLLLIDLTWIFHYFCMRVFLLFSSLEKRELPYSRKFSYYILNFSISYFSYVLNYNPDWLNWIPRKFLKNDKLFDLEICNVKLKYNGINFIKAICRNSTPSFKMKIRLVYTKVNVCKDTKKWAVKLKCSMFQLAAMGYRNNFHIILSLAMNCENKLLKI